MLLIYVNSKYGSLSFIKQYLDGYLLISIFNAALDTHTHGSPPPHPGIMDQLILTQAVECISCQSQNFQNKLKKEGIQQYQWFFKSKKYRVQKSFYSFTEYKIVSTVSQSEFKEKKFKKYEWKTTFHNHYPH